MRTKQGKRPRTHEAANGSGSIPTLQHDPQQVLGNVRAKFSTAAAVPFGYRRIPGTNGTSDLVPSKEEASVVALVFKLYLTDGLGLSAIAQSLRG
jgi:hypothetical protein